MPQIVEIPGIGEAEFPDGMSREDMAAAITQRFKAVEPKSPGGTLTQAGIGITQGGAQIGQQGNALLQAAFNVPFSPLNIANRISRGAIGEQFRGASEIAGQSARELEQLGEATEGPKMARRIAAGATSIAPAIAASPVGVPAAIAASALQSFGGTYAEAQNAYQAQGLTPEEAERKARAPAIAGGLATAAVTALGGKIAPGVEGWSRAFAVNGFKPAALNVLKNAGVEATEEGIDQLNQAVVAKLSYNPKMTLKQALSEAAEAVYVGGFLGGTLSAVRQATAPGVSPEAQPPVVQPPTPQTDTAMLPPEQQIEFTPPESVVKESLTAPTSQGVLPDEAQGVLTPATQEPLATPEVSPVVETAGALPGSPPTQEEAGSTPGVGSIETQGGISTAGSELEPTTPSAIPKTPKSQRQIITDLAKGLNIPIRFGRLTTTKFAGYFKRVPNLIGSKKANDIPVVSHEVGHKIDSMFGFSKSPELAAELNDLGDPSRKDSRSSWTPSKSAAYKMGEGMAEFTRYWLTDPAEARKVAPKMTARFEAMLDVNKDVGDVMRQAQGDIKVWREAEAQDRLRSHISIGTNPNKTKYSLSQLTRDLVDDLHIARLAVDDAERMSGRTLNPSENFYLLARNLRGSYGMADTFVRTGAVDFKTKEVKPGTSLEDAMKPVAGRVNDFRDWIVAKQAKELHRRGKETGLVPADVDVVVARFDGDQAFQEAFNRVKAWQDALLKYSVDAGLVSPDSAKAMRAMNNDYVPLHRVFEVGAGEPSSAEALGTGRGLNTGKPGSLMSRKGSPRDVVDPLETMVRNAYAIITSSEKAAINIAVSGLANRPGMGKWVERVSTPKNQVKVGIEKVKAQLEELGADLTEVPDDAILTFFQNSKQAPFGENIIRVVNSGKPEFYRLNRELFDTFHALDLEDSGHFMKILSSPAQLLRAGVTLAPDFALANAFRDTFGAAVISKYSVLPFWVTIRGISAMINKPNLVAEWSASGGRSAVEATYFDRKKLQNFLAERITKDLTPGERALIITKSPLTALRWLTGTFEEATRIGEYEAAFKELTKNGMPEGEARRLAAFEARDRQDFSKGGAKTKILRHAAAFWNAALQANVRLAQAFKDRPFATLSKGLLFITIPKLLEQALNWDDEDYWDRPQWERDLFFLIPIGKGNGGHTRFLRLPIPFELGVIFATFPGRVLQTIKQGDIEGMAGFPMFFLKNTVPNPVPQTAQVIFSDFLSGKQGWDIWRGRPIVPDALANLPPEMQWTQQTSLTARKIGNAFGYSPLKVDHIIQQTTGGMGRQITHQILDRAIASLGGDQRTAENTLPGQRFVSSPAAVSSDSLDKFYKVLEELRSEKERAKAGIEPTERLAWLDSFEQIARGFSELNRNIRAEKDPKLKQEFLEMKLSIARETMSVYNKEK